MKKYFLVVFLVMFFLSGCAVANKGAIETNQKIKKEIKIDKAEKKAVVKKKSKRYKIGKKSFPNEDELILTGLNLAKKKNYIESAKVFEELYDKSYKEIYLIEALKLMYHSGKYKSNTTDRVLKKASLIMDKESNLKRMVAIFHLYQGRGEVTKKLANELIAIEPKNHKNYHLIALVHKQKEEYQKSYDYFMKAYNINQNNDSIKNAFDVQYNFLMRRAEAKSLLETHIRMQGCSKDICLFLARIYRMDSDYNSMADIYRKLYAKYGLKKYMDFLVDIYMYQRDYDKAIVILKRNDSWKKLMRVYATKKDFKEASRVANKIYTQSGDSEFLAMDAIYEYEYQRETKNFKDLSVVLSKLKQVVLINKKAEYLNYYGYLLIDHDVDIKNGIKHIKKALEKKPAHSTYLDSLAWGYYKDGKCKDAYKIMKDIAEGSDDEDIIKHFKIIKKCGEKAIGN